MPSKYHTHLLTASTYITDIPQFFSRRWQPPLRLCKQHRRGVRCKDDRPAVGARRRSGIGTSCRVVGGRSIMFHRPEAFFHPAGRRTSGFIRFFRHEPERTQRGQAGAKPNIKIQRT